MNRWYFWVLAPILLGLAGFCASVPHADTATAIAVQLALVAVPALATLGLANPIRFRWALRLVAGALVAAALGCFRVLSPGDAALVLLIVGWPALRYVLSGQSDTVVDVIAAPETAKRRTIEGSAGAS